MPLTFSHPAFAVPFARRGLVLSALVLGSMAPDFPYFLRLSATDQFGHSPAGLLLFCVPAALAALAAFHGFLKAPLLDLLPDVARARLAGASPEFPWGPGVRLGLIALSALIGAATHAGIDAFTHAYGAAVVRIDGLRTPVMLGPHLHLPLFGVLQHATSVVGAAALAAGSVRWWRAAVPASVAPSLLPWRRRVALLAVLPAAGCAGGLAIGARTPGGLAHFAFAAVVGGTSTLVAAAVVYCAGWHALRRRRAGGG